MRLPIMPIFLEDQQLLKLSMDQQSLEKSQIDGKETQITLDQLNFQPLNLLLKRKLIQTILQVQFHKKLINNMMEFHSLKNLLISQMLKTLMISKTGIIQISNQIQELITKRRLQLKKMIKMLSLKMLRKNSLILILLRMQVLHLQTRLWQ